MTGLLIYGPTGSGKTTEAKKLAGEEYIILDPDSSFGTLTSGKTIIVDNADLLSEKELETIIKHTRGNLILTCTDLGKIPKGIKANLNKLRAGLTDKRKEQTLKIFPASDDTLAYNSNIFRVLENVYGNPDRFFVDDMLNELKPEPYMLIRWMAENGDNELLHYLEPQLFKVSSKFLYSTIAHGVPVRNRRIKWPKRNWPDGKIIDFMREHCLRMSDAVLLKDVVEKKKVYKMKKKTKPKKEEMIVTGGSDRW